MGFGIKKEAGSNTTPSQIVNFDQVTPTTVGVVFDPDMPQTLDVLYVSSVNASTWIWNGTAYVTYSAPSLPSTEWYLLGTTIDAGSNKTAAISRNNAIYTIGYDSYFNMVRIGRGGGSSTTNTVVGIGAGTANTTGVSNVFFGNGAGTTNTTGTANTFIGTSCGYFNTIGSYNTFLGGNSGGKNTTAINNTFLGYNSGYNTNTGGSNTFNGFSSGFSNTTGGSNSFFGDSSGRSNTTGIYLSGVGVASLYSNTTGNDNVGLGLHSLFSNVTGSNNTSVGNFAGRWLHNGTSANTTPENSVFLGYDTRALTNNDTNQIVIGYLALGKGSNTVNIGNTSITNTYLNGAVTVNNAFTLPTTDGTANYFLKTNGSGTVTWGVAGLSFFSEAQSTTAPNATVYANSLTAVSTTANADFSIIAKGTGAILARVPDNTGTGGNKRGQYALDLSRFAGASGTYIAAGDYDIILGGTRNSSNTGTFAFMGNGDFNSVTGQYGTILNGNNNSVTGARGIVLNGQYSQANGAHALAGAGLYNYANGGQSVALCNGTTASGTGSMSINQGTTASGQNSFAGGNGSTADAINGFAIGDLASTNGIRNKFVIGGSGYSVGATQAGIVQLDARTTTNTPTVLQANTQNSPGIVASTQFTLPNNSLMRVKGSIQGKQSGSTNVGVWDFDAVLVRGATASTIIIAGTHSISLVVNTGGFGNPTITVNTTIGCMTVTVTGLAATNIQWACRIDSCETLYA